MSKLVLLPFFRDKGEEDAVDPARIKHTIAQGIRVENEEVEMVRDRWRCCGCRRRSCGSCDDIVFWEGRRRGRGVQEEGALRFFEDSKDVDTRFF